MSEAETIQLPFARGSATSEAAAKRAKAFAGSQRERLIQWFQECGKRGTTRPEAARALDISENSLRPRWQQLAGQDKRSPCVPVIYKVPTERDGCEVWAWRG